jgi:hypothetical protein
MRRAGMPPMLATGIHREPMGVMPLVGGVRDHPYDGTPSGGILHGSTVVSVIALVVSLGSSLLFNAQEVTADD